jgi:4-hydroxy-2-oxoheptanedioate aldolase
MDYGPGLWSSMGARASVEVLAAADPGWICLDLQHGLWSQESAVHALLCARRPVPLLARVGLNAPDQIGRMLDAGASGVIVPMVETVEQARDAASWSAYPPKGTRSWGPMLGYGAKPPEHPPGCFVMIETRRGLDNAADIAATPGLAGLFVGPYDLARSLGMTLPDLLSAQSAADPLPRITAACRSAGIVAAGYAGRPDVVDALRSAGFTMLATAADTELLAGAAASDAAAWRGRWKENA